MIIIFSKRILKCLLLIDAYKKRLKIFFYHFLKKNSKLISTFSRISRFKHRIENCSFENKIFSIDLLQANLFQSKVKIPVA